MELDLLLTEELQREFLEYLKEDPEFEIIDEEILNEGKFKDTIKRIGSKIKGGADKIRWKLALFSLRFLKESSINDFLRAYYSDKEGKETEKSKEWVAKSKKEKLARMRELANEMDQKEKDKIANSEAAKKLEKSAVISGITAGVAGASAAISGTYGNRAARIEKDAKNATFQTGIERDGWIKGSGEEGMDTYITNGSAYGGANKDYFKTGKYTSYEKADGYTGLEINGVPHKMSDDAGILVKGDEQYDWSSFSSYKLGGYITTALSALTSILFSAMWGSIIIAGVSAVRGIRSAHKANVIRRDEIMSELLKNKDKRDLKECLEFLNGDIDSQIALMEMYDDGDHRFYDAVENIKERIALTESFNNLMK